MLRAVSIRLIPGAVVLSASALLVLVHPRIASGEIPFELLKKAEGTSFHIQPKSEVLTSQDELLAAWTYLGRHDQPPVVDFQRHSAIFYFAGAKSSGGYSVNVEQIRIRGGVMEVQVVETVPGSSCGTTQKATFPFVLVQTIPWKRSMEPVVRQVVHECN